MNSFHACFSPNLALTIVYQCHANILGHYCAYYLLRRECRGTAVRRVVGR
jgi:hypothetical protein